MHERFMLYLRDATSSEDAATAARADLKAAIAKIDPLSCGLDLTKVVASVRVTMMMNRAITGTDVSAAVLELIALALMCRDSATPETDEVTVESGFMPPHIEEAARTALTAGSIMTLFESSPSDADSMIHFYSRQREITLRNPVYPHMLLDTLRGLFGDSSVHDDCQATLGFTGLEAVNVMDAVRSLSIAELEKRFTRMEAARDASLPFLQSWQEARRSEVLLPTEAHRAATQEVRDALEDLTTNIDQAVTIDSAAVAEHTGYGPSTVEAVLEAFTLTGLVDLDETLDRFFRGDNPLRTTPIVADTQGRRMLVHDALALPAVREAIETRLKASGRQKRYEKHRGGWVEDTALDLLARALPGAKFFRAFNYFIPDPRAVIPQSDPEKFTKRVEGDGLILIDDIALIIEVKSVALTAEARGGDARWLRGKLRDIITKAANQAVRLRERITIDKRIRLDADQWIDASGVREIHTIAIGLEDLSGVTTATTALLGAGILKPDHIPWTVSLHDLRIVCELLERPSELLLYLRRRTEPAVTWKYRAVDELDLFLLFLRRGLFVEPDPRERAQALPWSRPPSTSDIDRFENQHPEFVFSHTDPLDAWYNSQIDSSAPPADKPRLETDKRLMGLIDQVIETESEGWLPTTAAMLEGDNRVQRTFGRNSGDLAKLVRRDQKRHSITYLMGDTTSMPVLLVWVCHGPREDLNSATPYLLSYLQAKKHQTGAHRAACMIFDPTGKYLRRLLYDNRNIGPDLELDDAAAQLMPLEKMKKESPESIRQSIKRRTRNR